MSNRVEPVASGLAAELSDGTFVASSLPTPRRARFRRFTLAAAVAAITGAAVVVGLRTALPGQEIRLPVASLNAAAPELRPDRVSATSPVVDIDVLANDLVAVGVDLSLTNVDIVDRDHDAQVSAQVSIVGDRIRYAAPPEFSGVDTLRYEACAVTGCATATVIVEVALPTK